MIVIYTNRQQGAAAATARSAEATASAAPPPSTSKPLSPPTDRLLVRFVRYPSKKGARHPDDGKNGFLGVRFQKKKNNNNNNKKNGTDVLVKKIERRAKNERRTPTPARFFLTIFLLSFSLSPYYVLSNNNNLTPTD